jgi:hypothetical protein
VDPDAAFGEEGPLLHGDDEELAAQLASAPG